MVEYPSEPGRWVHREDSGLWGAWKMTKNPLIWLQRIWCCIPLRLVFMLQHRTSGDLDLVWLEALWKGYRGYSAALSGKLVIGKNEVKHWVHGRVGGHQILSVKDSHLTSGDLDLVVGVYGGVPMRARKTLVIGKNEVKHCVHGRVGGV